MRGWRPPVSMSSPSARTTALLHRRYIEFETKLEELRKHRKKTLKIKGRKGGAGAEPPNACMHACTHARTHACTRVVRTLSINLPACLHRCALPALQRPHQQRAAMRMR